MSLIAKDAWEFNIYTCTIGFIFIIIIIIFIYFFFFGSNPLNSFQSKSGPSQEDSNFYSGQKKKLIKK